MVRKVKITRIGNSAGMTIPKEMLDRHNLSVGDAAILIDTPDGMLLSAYDPDFEEAMNLYREGAGAYRNALRALAK